MAKPLEGIKVLDLTRALAGPFCALMLGDYGADVIKIERPGAGDDTRKWGPPFIGEESAYFLSVNRNKRSLTLNLRDEKAQQVFLKLAADADVIVENFTPDVMPNFNLGYEDVKKVNPAIIYCSISGFGATGPYRNRPAYDQIMQGISGLMSITGDLGGDPQKVGIAVADIGAGMWAAFAVMTALFHRDSASGGGKGQYIDLSMLDAQVAWMTYQAGLLLRHGRGSATAGRGASHPGSLPGLHGERRQVFQRGGGVGPRCGTGSARALTGWICTSTRITRSNGVRVNNRVQAGSAAAGILPDEGGRRVGGRPAGGERAGRANQRPCGRVRRRAGAAPGDAAGDAASDPGQHQADGPANQVFRDARAGWTSRRRCWGSTIARSSPGWAIRTPTWTRWPRRALSNVGHH